MFNEINGHIFFYPKIKNRVSSRLLAKISVSQVFWDQIINSVSPRSALPEATNLKALLYFQICSCIFWKLPNNLTTKFLENGTWLNTTFLAKFIFCNQQAAATQKGLIQFQDKNFQTTFHHLSTVFCVVFLKIVKTCDMSIQFISQNRLHGK